MNDEKRNPYIKFDSDEQKFWLERPTWFRGRYQRSWYERIDILEVEKDANEDVGDLVHKLIGYCRIRDHVIEHRESVAHHVNILLDMAIRGNYSAVELKGQIKLIQDYLAQMQVKSGLDPKAPTWIPPKGE